MGSRFEKFSERARRVLSLAQEEAQRLNHNYIGTEHVLLGLIRETGGVAVGVLSNLGVDLDQVRSSVEFIVPRGEKPVQGEVGLTPRSKKVVELAVDEARRTNAAYIGTEHLLIGLLREYEGIAATCLGSYGVTLDKVRAEIHHILSSQVQSLLPVSPSTLRLHQRGMGLVRLLCGNAAFVALHALQEHEDELDARKLRQSVRKEIGGVAILPASTLTAVLSDLERRSLVKKIQLVEMTQHGQSNKTIYQLTEFGVAALKVFDQCCEKMGTILPSPPSTS